MLPINREALLLAKVIALAALAAFVVFLIASSLIGSAKRQAAQARAGQAIASAQVKASADAISIQDQARTQSDQSEALSRDTADAIRQAPGADARLDPRLNRAALERLCQRPSLSTSPQCLQLVDRPDPPR